MKIISRGIGALIVVLVCAAASGVRADEGWVEGTISALDVTNSGNYGLRITLKGVSTMCPGGGAWGISGRNRQQ